MDALSVSWWAWLLVGLVLFALEAMTGGGMFLLFFGVGAVWVGLLDLAGLNLSFVMEGLVFVAISVVSMLLFRKPLLQRMHRHMPKGKVDNLVGEVAKALQDIGVDAIGTAELRGASWNAHNIGDAPIAKFSRCRVERIEGLTLHVREET